MANQSVLELAVGTGKWDAGLKKAKDALNNFTQAQGGLQSALAKDSDKMQQFVRMMGQTDSAAKTAKGQLNDYKGTIEQLTMQYNRMTDAQKQTIGQDYLRAIDQMKQKYQAVNKELQEMNQSLNATKSIDLGAATGGGLFGVDKLSGMLQVFGGNVMTKVAGVGIGLVGELKDAVSQGIELAKQGEGIRIAFERLGRGDILQGLREATHGTVTDLELMKAAVKFNDFKLPLDELGTMLAFAQQKAKDTGQSVDYMVDSIVTGLGRKSLMILDNLGLSATEIRDKMKETGDMTKAVGAIIRDQMAKAGDYVETAADRALQANVSLQNKMEELGRKFAPVQEASNQLWTSIKIGILDIVGGPLATLLNGLTKAGQLRNEIANAGGSDRVNADINKLKGSNFKPQAFQMMLATYSREEQAALNKWKQSQKGGMGSIAVWENRYLAAKALREEFQSKGNAVVNSTPATNSNPLPVVVTNTPTGGGGGFDANKTLFNTDTALMSGYKTPDQGGASDAFKAFLESERNNTDQLQQLTEALERLNESEGLSKKGTGEKRQSRNEKRNPYLHEGENGKQTAKLNEVLGGLAGGFSQITSGLEQMGVDIPEGINKAIGAMQGISTILTGIATTVLAIEAIAGADAIIPFARGGIIKAFSGTLVGNTYSGDQLRGIDQSGQLYGLNAGEVVLNRAQVGNLASQLSGGMAAMQLSAVITGEQLRLVLNNNGRRTGRGEYVTTNFR